MPQMGKYSKACLCRDFRQYPQWHENSQNARKEVKEVDGKEVAAPRILVDDSILYLQENYIVTDGIFKDENIIFNDVTEDWKKFCRVNLGFDIPGR